MERGEIPGPVTPGTLAAPCEEMPTVHCRLCFIVHRVESHSQYWALCEHEEWAEPRIACCWVRNNATTHVHVPSQWTRGTHLPLIVILRLLLRFRLLLVLLGFYMIILLVVLLLILVLVLIIIVFAPVPVHPD